jgi:hypothetical protein
VVGLCKNWHTRFTAKESSGREVRYCSAPTTLLYCVASFGPSKFPLLGKSLSAAVIGVLTDLQFSMFTCWRISQAYLSCVMSSSSLFLVNSIPKK